jgi:cytochrome c-type biogenesis protein CcmH/NrfG
MKRKFFLSLIALLSIPGMAAAQARGAGAGTSSTTNQQAGPESTSDIGRSANANLQNQQARSGDYLLGKVAVAGGELPWDPIPVTVTCSGRTSFTTATDAKGHFLIAPPNPATTSIANSTPANIPNGMDVRPKLAASFMGCNVEAALPGFNSTSVVIADRNLNDNPDIGTITLTREEGSAGSAVSATTAAAPKDAMKAFDKARAEWLDKKPDRAQKDLEKAVQIDPQFAEAWYQLGKIQEQANSPDAEQSFTKAAAADPKFSPPYEQLARIEVKAAKWQQVADTTDHELQLNPRGSPEIWYFSALADVKLDKKDAALASAQKAVAMDPLHTQPNSEQLLAVIEASKGEYADALQHLKSCLTYTPAGPNLDLIKQQIAQLEPLVSAPGK